MVFSQMNLWSRQPDRQRIQLLFLTLLLADFSASLCQAAASKTCDISSGFWVPTSRRPRYSASCPSLRRLWNCRANLRPDISYLSFRWQPESCDLSQFSAVHFGRMFRNKRLLMVGDSITANMFEAIACAMAASGKFTVERKALSYGFRGWFKLKSVFFREINFLLQYSFQAYVVKSQELSKGKQGGHIVQVQPDVLDPTMRAAMRASDLVLVGIGAWWQSKVPGRYGANSYVIGGRVQRNVTNLRAYAKALKTIRAEAFSPRFKGLLYFLSISPSHGALGASSSVSSVKRGKHGGRSSTTLGGGACGARGPESLSAVASSVSLAERYYSVQKRMVTFPARLLKITRLSEERPDGHVGPWTGPTSSRSIVYSAASKGAHINSTQLGATVHQGHGDCTHWCLPGIPDTWVDILYNKLLPEPAFRL